MESETVDFEGRVTAIDAAPMVVDGDGLASVETNAYGALTIRVPAGERGCPAVDGSMGQRRPPS